MRKNLYKILATAFISSSVIGCSTTKNKSIDQANPVEVSDQEDTSIEKIEINEADFSLSWKDCFIAEIPEAGLAVGLVFIIPEPVTFVTSLAYYGASMYWCAKMPSPSELAAAKNLYKLANELSAAMLSFKAMNEAEAKTVMEEAINKEKKALRANFVDIAERLQSLTDEELDRMQKLSGKFLNDFYEQLEVLKKGKFTVIEDVESEELIPLRGK